LSFQILPDLSIAFLLIFARIGTMAMLLPGLGERSFPVRVRLSVALILTLVFYPLASVFYPNPTGGMPQIIGLLLGELAIGFVLGIAGRMMLAALQTAGTIIAQQLGLGFVTSLDPSQGQQGALIGTFLSLMAIAMIFATDMHHLVIAALGQSYQIFRPGVFPDTGDASKYAADLAAGSFKIAVQISAPVLIFGLIFNVGLGVLARLMPQMQVFFIAMPASIILGFALLALVLAAMMGVYLSYMEQGLNVLLQRT
jgi:flagellar biosynthetic protein FliR